MKNLEICSYIVVICFLVIPSLVRCGKPVPKNFIVWGPGMAQDAVLPVRYVFIQPVDEYGLNITESLESNFSVKFSHPQSQYSRIFPQFIDVKDGSYILMFRMHQSYEDLRMDITYEDQHVGDSPYVFKGWMYHENCYCPVKIEHWLNAIKCKRNYEEMDKQLDKLGSINASETYEEISRFFSNPGAFSVVHYVIKDNKIYRRTRGQHVQFKTFTDSTLLSLSRKMFLPDMEFFFNLGDYALVSKSYTKPVAMFAWGGQKDSYELILPTYEIMTNTLNNLYSSYLDTLGMHGRGPKWSEKIEKAFFRGRDSSLARMRLYFLSKDNPDLIDANITRMFFFNWQNVTTTKDVPFFDFYNYKYIINMDGTVAPYRTPYLLGSNSLMLKEESDSYEFFYKLMKPNYHYISFKSDLSDLIQKVKWAQSNDKQAQQIALNAKRFAFDNLLPEHLYCYHAVYFQKYQERLVSKVTVLEDMEHVEQAYDEGCNCAKFNKRDEL